jgi:hypothetical protein
VPTKMVVMEESSPIPKVVECTWSEDAPDACPYCAGYACAWCGPGPHIDNPCECNSFERQPGEPWL